MSSGRTLATHWCTFRTLLGLLFFSDGLQAAAMTKNCHNDYKMKFSVDEEYPDLSQHNNHMAKVQNRHQLWPFLLKTSHTWDSFTKGCSFCRCWPRRSTASWGENPPPVVSHWTMWSRLVLTTLVKSSESSAYRQTQETPLDWLTVVIQQVIPSSWLWAVLLVMRSPMRSSRTCWTQSSPTVMVDTSPQTSTRPTWTSRTWRCQIQNQFGTMILKSRSSWGFFCHDSGWWWPGPQLRAVQPCTYRPQHQGIHPAPPQQPWGAQRHWEAVHWGWASHLNICPREEREIVFKKCLFPLSPVKPGWRVQGEVLPPQWHDWCRAGAAHCWPLPVWQARVSPADLLRHGPWLARRQRHLVRNPAQSVMVLDI